MLDDSIHRYQRDKTRMSLQVAASCHVPPSRPDASAPLHVLDLPQLHQKPPVSLLHSILFELAITPSSWDTSSDSKSSSAAINEEGMPAYLTRIIMSPLDWLSSDSEREEIWELASKRLAERSGRTAMPAMSRTFSIPTLSTNTAVPRIVDIKIHEPSLTGDNLGHKTWVASYLLAKRLPTFISIHFRSSDSTQQLPIARPTNGQTQQQPSRLSPIPQHSNCPYPRILELGAGTGLVGLTASGLLPTATVALTDLPAILPNLSNNINTNTSLTSSQPHNNITASALDWSATHPTPTEDEKYNLILAADVLYAPTHAEWLANTIATYLGIAGKILTELPFRCPKPPEHEQFRREMSRCGFCLLEEGEEMGFDDWEWSVGGEKLEVKCWWSLWGWQRDTL